jgi:hypothetical protein
MVVAMLFVPFDARTGRMHISMLVRVDVVAPVGPAAVPWGAVDEDIVRAPGEAD